MGAGDSGGKWSTSMGANEFILDVEKWCGMRLYFRFVVIFISVCGLLGLFVAVVFVVSLILLCGILLSVSFCVDVMSDLPNWYPTFKKMLYFFG